MTTCIKEQSGCVANDVRRVWARPMTSYGDGLNLFTTLWWTLLQLGCFSRTKNYGLTFVLTAGVVHAATACPFMSTGSRHSFCCGSLNFMEHCVRMHVLLIYIAVILVASVIC